MCQYLVFQMAAPMASWGTTTLGETRPSDVHPSRSAVMGLVAAALGIRRDDGASLARLDEAYHVGMWVESAGTPVRDYHSTQVVGTSRAGFFSRKHELGDKMELKTILSERDYRTDFFGLACLSCRLEQPPYSLERLAQALCSPRFSLYLGRKSCPLGLPLAPLVVSAGRSLEEAFRKYRQAVSPVSAFSEVPETRRWSFAHGLRARQKGSSVVMLWDVHANVADAAERIVTRRDLCMSRRTWQFANRQEAQALKPLESSREEK